MHLKITYLIWMGRCDLPWQVVTWRYKVTLYIDHIIERIVFLYSLCHAADAQPSVLSGVLLMDTDNCYLLQVIAVVRWEARLADSTKIRPKSLEHQEKRGRKEWSNYRMTFSHGWELCGIKTIQDRPQAGLLAVGLVSNTYVWCCCICLMFGCHTNMSTH